MKIDKIIEGLNRKNNTPGIGSSNFQDTNLTEVEKTFIKTYSPEKSLIFTEHLLQMQLIIQ